MISAQYQPPGESLANMPAAPANYHYSAFGLRISSELALPEFPACAEASTSPGVTVRFDRSTPAPSGGTDGRSVRSFAPDDSLFLFPGVAAFRVRHGRDIAIMPEPGVEDRLLRLYVEGMMMASLLHQRGYFVLHSSVVQIGDAAVAFLGHVGAGKSSCAAALHQRGHAVVSDDNAAIDLSLPELKVLPAFPSVKVFPKIAVALGYPESSLREMHSSQPKRARAVDRCFPTEPVPLKRIYVLTRDAEAEFSPLNRSEYLIEMIRNSVPTRWGYTGDANHLRQCARMTGLIPAWRVRTFNHLDELPDLARRIEEHSSEACVASA